MQKVTDEQNQKLIASIPYDEVKSVDYSMHPDKSSGKDGLNQVSFKHTGVWLEWMW